MRKLLRHITRLFILILLIASSTSAYARVIFESEYLLENSGNTWIIDSQDDVTGSVALQFGNSLGETITFDTGNSWFALSDDLNITGGLEVSSNIDLNSNQLLEARVENSSGAPATCDAGETGRLYIDTSNAYSYICNGTTWERIDANGSGASGDFEDVYTNDADNTLTTSDGSFTIARGSGAFTLSGTGSITIGGGATTVDVSTLSIDSTDTTNLTMTANDAGTKTLTVSATNEGAGAGQLAISTDVWDITGAGVASGLTGITSTGTIDFTGASRFAMHQGSSNPGTCTEGDQFYNTTDHTLYVCTATDTWSSAASVTEGDYVYSYDTTTQTIASADTFQDVTFNTNGQLDGWSHTTGTANFTAGASGLYLATVDAFATKTLAGAVYFEIIGVFNGTEIAGSESSIDIDPKDITYHIQSAFLFSATAGQVFKIQMASDSTTASIAPAAGIATTRPSIKLSIVRLN